MSDADRWGSLRPVRIDLDEVAAAIDHFDRSQTDHFLNLDSGEVITLSVPLIIAMKKKLKLRETDLPEWVLDDEPLVREILDDPHGKRWVHIPEGTWIDMGELRVRFIRAIKTPGILQEFAESATMRDAQDRFYKLLKKYPELSTSWYRFEARQKQAWAKQWLEKIGIEAI